MNAKPAIAHCEGCARPLFEGDSYLVTSDGCDLCTACAPMLSDVLQQMDQALQDGDWERWYGDRFDSESELRSYRDGLAEDIALNGDRSALQVAV